MTHHVRKPGYAWAAAVAVLVLAAMSAARPAAQTAAAATPAQAAPFIGEWGVAVTSQMGPMTLKLPVKADDRAVRATVLTSIDYAKMPAEVKAQEPAPQRTDHDYALSYIQREGKGRVFVEVLGHDESIYKQTPMLAHILAGMQYALGDLEADDTPSAARK